MALLKKLSDWFEIVENYGKLIKTAEDSLKLHERAQEAEILILFFIFAVFSLVIGILIKFYKSKQANFDAKNNTNEPISVKYSTIGNNGGAITVRPTTFPSRWMPDLRAVVMTMLMLGGVSVTINLSSTINPPNTIEPVRPTSPTNPAPPVPLPPPEPTRISEGCPLVPGSLTFSDTIETCLESFGCNASVRLCTGAAALAGRIVAGTVACPRQLGTHFALYERSLIADRLRLRRCYPESYSWLAGLTGPEAENARGGWRAKVCPEAPAVFSDPQFAQLGPITDGPCTR